MKKIIGFFALVAFLCFATVWAASIPPGDSYTDAVTEASIDVPDLADFTVLTMETTVILIPAFLGPGDIIGPAYAGDANVERHDFQIITLLKKCIWDKSLQSNANILKPNRYSKPEKESLFRLEIGEHVFKT